MKKLCAAFLLSFIPLFVLSQVKIEMKKEGGIYKVPCEINGLKLDFYLDTGAATISLSNSVADFMLKNGYLKKEDIYDKVKMSQADGSTFMSSIVKIRTVKIGGFILHDVVGTISPHQNAPLLLGQTAIQKLGKISIKDNYLIIEKESKAEYKGAEKDISFLGLKLYNSYSECYDVLCKKYGESNVSEMLTNDAPTLCVYNRSFNNHIFDEIALIFDDDYLSFVVLEKKFSKKDLQKALRERDQILKIYKKKYTAIKSLKSKGNGTTYYAIGYEHKKDDSKYPILLSLNNTKRTYHYEDGDEQEEFYSLQILYWVENYDNFYENHESSNQEDDY